MAAEWFYLIDGEQQGPVEAVDLKKLAASGTLHPADLVWRQGMPEWKPAAQMKGLFSAPPSPPSHHSVASDFYDDDYGQDDNDREYREFIGKKLAAGLCGILLGPLGIHKFVLGFSSSGVIMMLISVLTCGFGTLLTGPIGMIEGILYLTQSDEDFYENYAVRKREWF